MSRPRFVPTEEQRRTVKFLSAIGTRQEEIALMFDLRSVKSLRKHFRQELDRGSTEATAQVGQTLYKMARSGKHVAATIFWMKTRAHWRETPPAETRPAAIPNFVVALDKKAA